MTEPKKCPKCSGSMDPGSLKEIGKYGNSPYLFAPASEVPFQLPVKGQPSQRHEILVFRCEACGFLEQYAS